MTIDEASVIMDLITSEHPNFMEGPNPEYKIANWAEALADVPLGVAIEAAKAELRENHFPPKLADVISRINKAIPKKREMYSTEWEVRSWINCMRTIEHPIFPYVLREAKKYPSCWTLLTDEEKRIADTWKSPAELANKQKALTQKEQQELALEQRSYG